MTHKSGAPAPPGLLDDRFLAVERRLLDLSVSGEKGLLLLRLVLAGALLFQAARAVGQAGQGRLILGLPAAYALAALLVYGLRKSGRLSEASGPGTFMVDVGASIAVLRLTQSGQ